LHKTKSVIFRLVAAVVVVAAIASDAYAAFGPCSVTAAGSSKSTIACVRGMFAWMCTGGVTNFPTQSACAGTNTAPCTNATNDLTITYGAISDCAPGSCVLCGCVQDLTNKTATGTGSTC